MSLATLIVSASSLAFGQSDLPSTEQYITQHQKPPIYAQASEKARDENLERMLRAYQNLIFKPGTKTNILKMALDFYNDLIKENRNQRYTAEAYYYSGLILAELTDPKNVKEGIRRLEQAYNLGDLNIKIKAVFKIGDITYHHAVVHEKGFTFEYAEENLRKVRELAPGTESAKYAEKLLKKIRLRKPK